MKVVELIKKLNEIGYDKNTELTFSCTDGDSGECFTIPFEEISYGEDLTGFPYCNDVIDISVDVDSCDKYLELKTENSVEDIVMDIKDVLRRYR